MKNIDFTPLENSLIGIVMETQIKLGYSKNDLRLYYPLASLNRMFDTDFTPAEMEEALKDFGKFSENKLGNVSATAMGDNFCFLIPAEGTAYVHEKAEDNSFLKEFIQETQKPERTIDDLLSIFNKYSDKVYAHKIDNEEFDWLVYFEDGVPDDYRYCIKFEYGMTTCHRFTPKDFEALGF